MACFEYLAYGIWGCLEGFLCDSNVKPGVSGGPINEKCYGVYKLWPEE